MSTGPEDFRPKRRELALPDETANFGGIAEPKWDLNSIVGDTRAPKADLARFRSSLGPASLRSTSPQDYTGGGLTDRLTLARQLSRALKLVRESTENARRPGQTGRISEASTEREQAERKKDQQVKAAEVSKKAKSMIALLKSNPEAVAKLAAIVDSPQGQGFPEVFASIILDKDNAKPEQKPDVELATRAATELASNNPEFSDKLAKALIAQTAQADLAQYEAITAPGQNLVQTKGEQLAQILSEPNNRVLLDSVVQTALAEPTKAENAVVLQEIAKVPEIAQAVSNLSVAQVPLEQPTLEQPRSIQVASLDDNFAFAQTFDTVETLDTQPKPVNFTQVVDASTLVSSYSFSADLPQRIETLRTMINNFTPPDAATTASNFAAAPLEIPFKQAVQAEIYTNQNSSIEQVRDNLVTKLGINQSSKFTLEIQTVGTERTLVLVPTQALIQERPEMAAVKMPSVTETEIQTAKVEVQKLDKFISDINTTAEVSVASRFADFARNSTNSLGTVLAFRQVIMTMAKNSNMSGRDLAQKVKNELNLGLAGSNLTVETEADSILLNTIQEGSDSSSPKTLASVTFEEAPDGSLTTGQIELIKTAMVSALNDPFKLALLEQKLLQNGVMQSDIDALKVRALESGDVNQMITDAQATERIRNDLKNLVSYDRNERILAAEDLRLNNITGLSVGGGEIGFSIDKIDTATSVKVMIPGQQPDEDPISIEMYAYGGYDADNRDSERMQEFADAFLPLDYTSLPIQVLDKFGNAFTVSSQTEYSYGEAGPSEDENMYVDPDSTIDQQTNQPIDPNFNPFDYVNQYQEQQQQYVPEQQYIPEEQYDPEQGYDPEQEFEQNQDQYQDQYQQQDEIPPEYEEPYSDSEPYEEQ
jgi:hypothetical protein